MHKSTPNRYLLYVRYCNIHVYVLQGCVVMVYHCDVNTSRKDNTVTSYIKIDYMYVILQLIRVL